MDRPSIQGARGHQGQVGKQGLVMRQGLWLGALTVMATEGHRGVQVMPCPLFPEKWGSDLLF